jgi:phospholipid/cholesterol/gamma-HCH transport system ATP-binding protein
MKESKEHIDSKKEVTKETVISVKNLNVSFGDNHVLNNFSLDLPKGENIAVLGKSGSGKSVFIKCIIGLIQPNSGEINVLGKNPQELSPEDLDELRMRMGFLFQSNALYDSMTVRENLEFPMDRHGKKKPREEMDELVQEALENVGLPDTEDMMPSELSGGMKKRIALARTLILRPEIILYDEPTTGLDLITGKGISELIVEIQHKYNASSFVISHDINCIKIVSNRIAMLIDGECYAIGTFDELKRSNDKKIKPFFEY